MWNRMNADSLPVANAIAVERRSGARNYGTRLAKCYGAAIIGIVNENALSKAMKSELSDMSKRLLGQRQNGLTATPEHMQPRHCRRQALQANKALTLEAD